MNSAEFNKKLEQAGVDRQAAMAQIVVTANATQEQFEKARKLREAVNQKYNQQIADLQKAMGINNPLSI